jgi:hypothetical protein
MPKLHKTRRVVALTTASLGLATAGIVGLGASSAQAGAPCATGYSMYGSYATHFKATVDVCVDDRGSYGDAYAYVVQAGSTDERIYIHIVAGGGATPLYSINDYQARVTPTAEIYSSGLTGSYHVYSYSTESSVGQDGEIDFWF